MSHNAIAPHDPLRGVDRAAFASSLGLRLRGAGVDVGLTSVETFARAIEVNPPARRSTLYWSARVAFVRRPEDLPAYDAVFAAVFEQSAPAIIEPRERTRTGRLEAEPAEGELWAPLPNRSAEAVAGQGLPWLRLPRVVDAEETDDDAARLPERRPSSLDAVADTPFDELDPAALTLLDQWLVSALDRWPTRPSRRMADRPSGRRISLRRTMAGARRTGFEPVDLHRVHPVRRPRRLLMLVDVSQSMEAYAPAYLHLMRAAAVVTHAEVFAFSTSLTRLTSVLAHRSPDVAIRLAADRVTDRFGGTRIATNLRTLLASHHGQTARGAVVVIASDGWDSDDPQDLAVVMRRLRGRAERVIWLNPRAGAPGFQPLVGSMAAALPFCDLMVPARTLRDLEAVVEALTAPELSSRA